MAGPLEFIPKPSWTQVQEAKQEKVPTPPEQSSTVDTLRQLAATGVRVGTGIAGSIPATVPGIGTAWGAAWGGGGELLAELIEGSDPSLARIGVEAGLTAVPGGKLFQAGRALKSAVSGAGLAGVGVVGRQLAESDKPGLEKLQDVHVGTPEMANIILGGGLGAYFGRNRGGVGGTGKKFPADEPAPQIQRELRNSPALPTTEELTKSGPVGVKFAADRGKAGVTITPPEHSVMSSDMVKNPKGIAGVSVYGPEGAPAYSKSPTTGEASRLDSVVDKRTAEEIAEKMQGIRGSKEYADLEKEFKAADKAADSRVKAHQSLDKKTAVDQKTQEAREAFDRNFTDLKPAGKTVTKTYTNPIEGGTETGRILFKTPKPSKNDTKSVTIPGGGGIFGVADDTAPKPPYKPTKPAPASPVPPQGERSYFASEEAARNYVTAMGKTDVDIVPQANGSFRLVPKTTSTTDEIVTDLEGRDLSGTNTSVADPPPDRRSPTRIPGEEADAHYTRMRDKLAAGEATGTPEARQVELDKAKVAAAKAEAAAADQPVDPDFSKGLGDDIPVDGSGKSPIEQIMTEPPSPVSTPRGVIPVRDVRRSPKDVAGAHYRSVVEEAKASSEPKITKEFKDNPTSGLGPSPRAQGARIAGKSLYRMGKLEETPPTFDPGFKDDIADLASLPIEQRRKVLEALKKAEGGGVPPKGSPKGKRGGPERGAASVEASTSLIGGLGGAAYGGATTPEGEDPISRAILFGTMGAGAGYMAPAAVRGLLDQAEASGDSNMMMDAANKAKDTFVTAIKLIPDIQRFNWLANAVNLPINAFVGPYGSAFMRSLEGLQAGEEWALPALKTLLTTDIAGTRLPIPGGNFIKGLGRAAEEMKASNFVDEAYNRGEVSDALENAPSWIKSLLSYPGRQMTKGDISARNILTDAGAPESVARAATLTDEGSMPVTKWLQQMRKGPGSRSWVASTSLPFVRTIANQLEGTFERFPGFAKVVSDIKVREGSIPDSEALQQAQQILGGGVLLSTFTLGMMAEPDPVKTPIYMKLLSNFGGQYGLLAAGAFAAGQAYQSGDKDAILTFGNRIIQGTPLPSLAPITENFKFATQAAQGEAGVADIPSGMMPRQIKDLLTGE